MLTATKDDIIVPSKARKAKKTKSYQDAILYLHMGLNLLRDFDVEVKDPEMLESYGQAILDYLYTTNKITYTDAYAFEYILEHLYKTNPNAFLFTRIKKIKDSKFENEYQFFIEGFGDQLIVAPETISAMCVLKTDGWIPRNPYTFFSNKRTVMNYNTSIRVQVDFHSTKTIARDLAGLQHLLAVIDRY
jgi:hypothetical protein